MLTCVLAALHTFAAGLHHESHGLIPNTTWIPWLASLAWLGFCLSGALPLQPLMHLRNV